MSAPSPTTYQVAGLRHHRDAAHLFRDGRLASADHLAGFAAECLLKHIAVEYLGRGARPLSAEGRKLGHLPVLWNELLLLVDGRSGSRFVRWLAGSEPFAVWRVDDRYTDGSMCTEDLVMGHLDAADCVAQLIEQAELDGELP